MNRNFYDFLPTVVGLILAIGVMTIFSACKEPMDDGMWMSCHYAQMYVFADAVVMVVLSLIGVFVSNYKVRICVDFVEMVLTVFAAFIPGILVGLCMMDTMRCHILFRPFTIVVSIVLLVTIIVKTVFDFKRKMQVAMQESDN